MSALNEFMSDFYKCGTHQRLGQYFVNTYIKKDDETTKGMFHEVDFNKARVKIGQFIMSNQWDSLPSKLGEDSDIK